MKGIFGNSKFALGFAGVTVAFAAIAALGVNQFVPSTQQAAPQDTIVEIDADQRPSHSAAPPPPRTAQTWADEGSLSDDWNTASTASNSNASAWGGQASSTKPEVEFKDFELERPRSQQQTASRSSSAQSNDSDGVTIISRAAPGAPPLVPPN